jgi:hypothetical protein
MISFESQVSCNTLLAHILKQSNGSGILFLVATQGAIHGYQEAQAIELAPSPKKKRRMSSLHMSGIDGRALASFRGWTPH